MAVNKPLELLMGVTMSEMGGAQKVVYDLIAALPREKYSITLLTHPGGELLRWIEKLNSETHREVKIIEMPELRRELSPYYDVKAFIKLYKIMRYNRYDIAHFHSSKIGILGRMAAGVANIPNIYFTVHGWGINEYQHPILRKLLGFSEMVADKRCTKAICVSKYHRDLGIRMRWLRPDRSTVIYNGIDKAPRSLGKLRKELDLAEDIPIIGTVMRLREPKQPIFTIEVFDKILKMGHKAKLVIIGDGPLSNSCRETIDRLGLEGCVFMLGTRGDARELMNDMDIVTLFSKWEGLPVTIMEAMFAAKPIVCSGVGGIPEVIDHGIDGFIIKDFDLNEAAGLITALLQDRALMEKIGGEAYRKTVEGFSKDRMVASYEAIYSGGI